MLVGSKMTLGPGSLILCRGSEDVEFAIADEAVFRCGQLEEKLGDTSERRIVCEQATDPRSSSRPRAFRLPLFVMTPRRQPEAPPQAGTAGQKVPTSSKTFQKISSPSAKATEQNCRSLRSAATGSARCGRQRSRTPQPV